MTMVVLVQTSLQGITGQLWLSLASDFAFSRLPVLQADQRPGQATSIHHLSFHLDK